MLELLFARKGYLPNSQGRDKLWLVRSLPCLGKRPAPLKQAMVVEVWHTSSVLQADAEGSVRLPTIVARTSAAQEVVEVQVASPR